MPLRAASCPVPYCLTPQQLHSIQLHLLQQRMNLKQRSLQARASIGLCLGPEGQRETRQKRVSTARPSKPPNRTAASLLSIAIITICLFGLVDARSPPAPYLRNAGTLKVETTNITRPGLKIVGGTAVSSVTAFPFIASIRLVPTARRGELGRGTELIRPAVCLFFAPPLCESRRPPRHFGWDLSVVVLTCELFRAATGLQFSRVEG